MLAFVNSKKYLRAFSLIELLIVLAIVTVFLLLGVQTFERLRWKQQQRVFLKNLTVLLEYGQSMAWSQGVPLYLTISPSGVDLFDSCHDFASYSKAHLDILPVNSHVFWEGFVPGECFAIYPDFHESVRNGRFIYESKVPPLFRYEIVMNRLGRVKLISII